MTGDMVRGLHAFLTFLALFSETCSPVHTHSVLGPNIPLDYEQQAPGQWRIRVTGKCMNQSFIRLISSQSEVFLLGYG